MFTKGQPLEWQTCAKLPFKIPVNASKGQKGSTGLRGRRFNPQKHSQDSVEELKLAKERHSLKRAGERDKLQRGSPSNREFLQGLDAKECVLEIQAMILGKLAAEENKLKGLADDCKTQQTQEQFSGRMQDVVEAISVLKY